MLETENITQQIEFLRFDLLFTLTMVTEKNIQIQSALSKGPL